MPAAVAVVVDSTAYLPAELALAHGITVVPVSVVIDGQVFDETTVSTAQVAEALRSFIPVSTSRPSPHRFEEAYAALADRGFTSIVSLHLSAELSGTYESAQIAAGRSPIPVQVIDSRTIGMALGFAAVTAAKTAEEGATTDEVADHAQRRLAASSILFYVDTLEYLRRGGRIGKATALLGSALSVKPILHVLDGRVETLDKVRTTSKALTRIEELALERVTNGGPTDADVVVHQLDNASRAADLAASLQGQLPAGTTVDVLPIGAVVGAHVGPGTIAVVVAPRTP